MKKKQKKKIKDALFLVCFIFMIFGMLVTFYSFLFPNYEEIDMGYSVCSQTCIYDNGTVEPCNCNRVIEKTGNVISPFYFMMLAGWLGLLAFKR